MAWVKWLLVVVLSCSILVFIPNAYHAATTESLKQGFINIAKNPWALAAFSDFVIGFAFHLTLICVRETSDQVPGRKPCYWTALFWVILALLIGNPAVLSYFIYQLVKAPSIQDAIFVRIPSQKSVTSGSSKVLWWLFSLGMAGLFVYYVWSCVVALSSQSIGDGWKYIQSDPWAYLTFVDNSLGVLFTTVYIAVSQHPKWIPIVTWWLALWLLGNGTTAIYVLMLCWNKYSSLSHALLYREQQDM